MHMHILLPLKTRIQLFCTVADFSFTQDVKSMPFSISQKGIVSFISMASILLNIWPKILTLFVKTDLNSELYNSRIWNQKKKEILICALIPIHSSVYCMRSWSFNPTNSEWIIFTDNAYDTCRFLLLFCMLILIYDLTDIQTNVKNAKI